MDKRLVLIFLIFLLSSCGWIPNLGKNEVIYGNKTERIAVLKEKPVIHVDHSMENVSIKIPNAKYNDKWYKSSGYHYLIPENIRSPINFNVRGIEKIGKGVQKGEHILATPVVANGKIYTIDARGLITASDVENIRKQIWKFKIDIAQNKGNFSNAGLLYSQNRLFVSTGYNRIIALDSESGNLVWKRTINSIARSAPAANDGVLLVNTIDNKLYALDTEDGAILWKHTGVSEEISVYGSISPVIHDNIVFTSYSSGELYALNLRNGNNIWYDTLADNSGGKNDIFSDINSPPIIVGNRIYVINNKGVLIAYDIYNGLRIWERELLGGKTPWHAGNFIYLLNKDNQLLSVHINTGAIRWIKQLPHYRKPQHEIGLYVWNGPVMAGDFLIMVGAHGKLLFISPKNGDTISTTEILKGVHQPPVIAHDTVFLLTDKAKLVAYKDSKNIRSKSLTKVEDEFKEKTKLRKKRKIVRHRINMPSFVKNFFGGDE